MARRRLLRTMKVRAPMPMRAALTNELAMARDTFAVGGDGWRHLERAHVLSQPWAWDHVRVHASMLCRAWHEGDRVELRGRSSDLSSPVPDRSPIATQSATSDAPESATTPMTVTDDDVRAALTAAGQPTRT